LATATQTVQTAEGAWPSCPSCGSSKYVHRAGLHNRRQFPPAQKYACTNCGKDRKFLSPDVQKYRPGRVKRLNKQFRECVTMAEGAQPLQTRFEVDLPVPLAESLMEWFKESGDKGDNIARFANQVFVLPIVERRRRKLPKQEPPEPQLARGDKRIEKKDNRIHCRERDDTLAQRIIHLRTSELLTVAQIAARTGYSGTSIRTIMSRYENHAHVQPRSRRACKQETKIHFGKAETA
jgi:transposase-like protein